jgi:4-amino-4-deoxy-L-arabinose transferase-like glycosyltransferase
MPLPRRAYVGAIALFAFALVLRLAFLLLTMRQYTASAMLTQAPDTQRYVAIAGYMLNPGAPAEADLFYYGPGYGAFLAACFAAFGPSPWPVLVVQAILGSIGCVLVYCLGRALLPTSRYAAIGAGAFAAVSLSSISLNAALLSETLFFVLQAGSLLCLVYGLQRKHWRWFLASGLLSGSAALTRSVAQFWPAGMILIVLIIPQSALPNPKRSLLLRTCVAAGIAVAITFGWSARNLWVHNTFTLASGGAYTARQFWTARGMVRVTGQSLSVVRNGWPPAQPDQDVQVVLDRLVSHPWPMILTYALTVKDNVISPLLLWLHPLDSLWAGISRIQKVWGLGLALLSCAGLLSLRRRPQAAACLGVTYAYFVGISGFTFATGGRVVFPAQMASALLVARCCEVAYSSSSAGSRAERHPE